MTMPSEYAQTNVQLYQQLCTEKYSSDARQLVFVAYEFGIQLFSGLFLPSGKPFIDHLVGTASILVSLHAPAEIVAAGLLHAAYVHGDFGSPRKGITHRKQTVLRNAVGPAIEEYVTRYHHLHWSPARIPLIRAAVHEFDTKDREVLFIRLVNEMEHHLDLGALYFAGKEKAQAGHQQYLERYGPMMIEMAQELGHCELAARMAALFRENMNSPIPVEPCIPTHYATAYLKTPASYRERLWIPPCRKILRIYRTAIQALRRAKSAYLAPLTGIHHRAH